MPERCAMCPGVNTLVQGYGSDHCDYFFIAEAPGKDENKIGIPLVGKTGKEFHEQYLPLAGIHPLQIYKDNAVSCLPTGDGKLDPSDPKVRELIDCCAKHHLYEAIKVRKPKLIIPMGGVAATLIPGLDLDMHYGMPFSWDVPGVGEYPIFPTWHPALGLHSPKEMLKIRSCFIRLKRYIEGTLKIPCNNYTNPDYTVLSTVLELDEYMLLGLDSDEWCNVAIDTETTRKGAPFCLTFSIRPGTARLIKAENKEVLARFSWYMSKWGGWIILHNRLFDRGVLRRMGVKLPSARIQDTMMEAYHLGNLPQGLKTLAYRQLGVEMKSFDDLTRAASSAKVLEYYSMAFRYGDWAKPEEQLIRDTKGEWKIYKPQSFGTKLKRFFTDLEKNPNLDLFARWNNWEEHHEEIQAVLGEWPGKCITHAPFDEVISYACEDAARTLELWPIMDHAERLTRKRQEHTWYD